MSRLVVVRVSDVEAARVRWLWQGRIPGGKVTVLDGDPGLGKSTVTLDLTARITTGSPLPGETGRRPPADVVLLSAEDGIDDTIRPRLEAAGANCERAHVVDHVIDEDGTARPPELPGDLPEIQQLIVETGAVLLIVDPLMAFLAGEVNAHRDQDVRRALPPFKGLAEATGCAVLVVRHLNKAPGGNPLYRGGGSIGIGGAARSVLLVAQDPHDETRRIIASAKSNLGPTPEALAYRIVADELRDCALVSWAGTVAYSAADLLTSPVEAPKRDQAEELLSELLADGPMRQSDIKRHTDAAGVSWRTVETAKKRLGIISEQRPVEGKRGAGPSWWRLPNAPHTGSQQETLADLTDHSSADGPQHTPADLAERETPGRGPEGNGLQGPQGAVGGEEEAAEWSAAFPAFEPDDPRRFIRY
jgi:hypothetical protein